MGAIVGGYCMCSARTIGLLVSLIFILPMQAEVISVPQESQVVFQKGALRVEAFKGKQGKKFSADIIRFYITMFKEFPYLYDGSYEVEKEEKDYFYTSDCSLTLIVFDQDEIVGVSRSILLSEYLEDLEFSSASEDFNQTDYMYIAEVMIKEQYRGQGLLRLFFDYHEQFAREQKCSYSLFATVVRPVDHPLRPVDYRSLEPLWKHFGYTTLSEPKMILAWKQIDTEKLVDNQLDLWCKKVVNE